MIKKVNFKTTKGILTEIEDSVNEFKADTTIYDQAELRIRGCNSAIKIHMLDYVVNKLEEQKKRIKNET